MATVLFDVNETLLSLAPMTPHVDEVLGPGATTHWFARLLHASLVANHLTLHPTFEDLGARELQRLAAARTIDLDLDRARAVSARLRQLPAHPDVVPGLESLHAAGHRIVAFTNGSTDAVADQLDHAGIRTFFDDVLSVDAGPAFKPDRRAYLSAASRLGARPASLILVAAHDWDVAGARAAGLRGVFLTRTGHGWWMAGPQGDTITSVGQVATLL